jgi:hypothetical protein
MAATLNENTQDIRQTLIYPNFYKNVMQKYAVLLAERDAEPSLPSSAKD